MRQNKRTHAMTLRLTQELDELLTEAAYDDRRSKSDLIRPAIRQSLQNPHPQRPQENADEFARDDNYTGRIENAGVVLRRFGRRRCGWLSGPMGVPGQRILAAVM